MHASKNKPVIPLYILLIFLLTRDLFNDINTTTTSTTWDSKMSLDPSQQKPNPQSTPGRSPKGNEVAPVPTAVTEELVLHAQLAAAQLMPSVVFSRGKEMGEISEKISGLREENSKLKEKLKTFKKDNAAMNQKIDSLQNHNRKQEETILALESSQEKLKTELEDVKKAKEQLRIEIEGKISKFSAENNALTKKWDDLTKEFEAVESENKELKETVDLIKLENQQLKDEMGDLKTEHKNICEKLECKEARLVLGQVAWLLEAEIWKVVLPNEKMGITGILNSMERWLKKKKEKPEGKAAQKRWDDLKGKLNWDEDDHKWALGHLKKLRIVDAHPEPVDLEEARKQLKDGEYVADTDKDLCEQIIDMVSTARKLNNTTD